MTPGTSEAALLKKVEPEKKSNWGLIIFTLITVFIIVPINTVPAIKEFILSLGQILAATGWYGPLLMILVSGLIIIPIGFPYTIFEMMISVLINPFPVAVATSIIAKTLGSGIIYFLVKYKLRDRIRRQLQHQTIYRGFMTVLERHPMKFSTIIRMTALPFFLKNYGLAIPYSVTFRIYMLAGFIAALPWTTVTVYIFRQVINISDILNPTNSPLQKTFTIFTILISLSLLLYVVYYTKKVLMELEDDKKIDAEYESTISSTKNSIESPSDVDRRPYVIVD